jgi:hypothetical protein
MTPLGPALALVVGLVTDGGGQPVASATTMTSAAKEAPTNDPPAASPSPAEAARYPLTEAEAALRAGIHKKCVELAQQALGTGRLDPPSVARAWLVRGRCHAIDGDPDRAERSYAVAVRVQPDIVLPTDDAVFARVRPEGTAPSSSLSLTASTVVVAPGLVGIATRINDDLGLGRAFVLVNADDREVARAPIERAPDAMGDAFVRPGHRFSGFPVVDLRARLLDKHGNVLRETPVVIGDDARAALASAGAPIGAPSDASSGVSSSTSTWVSLAGAGAATAGFALAATGGLAFASAAQADPERVVDDEGLPFAAFVGGTVLFVAGAVVVVVDQWPR